MSLLERVLFGVLMAAVKASVWLRGRAWNVRGYGDACADGRGPCIVGMMRWGVSMGLVAVIRYQRLFGGDGAGVVSWRTGCLLYGYRAWDWDANMWHLDRRVCDGGMTTFYALVALSNIHHKQREPYEEEQIRLVTLQRQPELMF